ncbi:MAG TPA: ethylbenzene dehydrogenase-related protein, partial [Gemmatimonadaceae bacterium]
METVVTFAAVQTILTARCGTCHHAASGRTFLITMDSLALLKSGLVNPTDPGTSMLTQKPRSATAHGGGVVSTLTAADIQSIEDWIGKQPQLNLGTLVAKRIDASSTPQIDGYANDGVWRVNNDGLVITIGGGWADARDVTLKAAYDAQYLYMLVRWIDDAASVVRQPWEKQADGTWKTLSAKPRPVAGSDWSAYMGTSFEEEGPGFAYEDKMALIWNTYGASTVAGFDQTGCAVLCHDPAKNFGPGNTYNYDNENLAAKKYTNAANEIADMWHWKLVRMNHHNKLDDQYVGFWQPGGANPANGGRYTDAGAGGYANNPPTGGRPTYRGAKVDAPPYYILDQQKVALLDAELAALPVGTRIPNMITSGPTGTRADVDARGEYNPANKTWTVEIRRKLVTGDTKDVQFDSLAREYAFGVSIFDNA